ANKTRKRKADYRHNQLEFELPDPVKPGVSCIRPYQPVAKINNTDGKQRRNQQRATPGIKFVTGSTITTKAGRLRKLSLDEILATPGTPVVYLTNRFGSAKVELDEHHYAYHFAANGVSYYRCDQYKSNQCPAQILVVGEIHRMLANTFTSSKEKSKTSLDDFMKRTVEPTSKEFHVTPPSSQRSSSSLIRFRSHETQPPAATTNRALNFSQITKSSPVPMSLIPTRKGAAGILCRGHHFEFRYSQKPELRYIRNSKGSQQLCIDGFPFTRHVINKGTVYWRCIQFRAYR
uniref:FLYWCH-type domain-containing protein n=1 Tax=Anopheles maculatus TaxID=74869 RepID=A0A182TA42_9DIPT